MPPGIRYNVLYIHARKEVVIDFQIGSMPPIHIVMSAEAFCQDLDFLTKNEGLAKYLAIVRERKDLPVDHDFGPGGGQMGFDPKGWDNKMGGPDAPA